MTQDRIYAFVEEDMKTIFAYACSRVPHKQEAEDLAGDIIAALLARGRTNPQRGSAVRLCVDHRRKHLSRSICGAKAAVPQSSGTKTELGEIPDDEDFAETLLQSERLNRLRRELSLLSGQYRERAVRLLFRRPFLRGDGRKVCISRSEMVKYYLFKTRKILKEEYRNGTYIRRKKL